MSGWDEFKRKYNEGFDTLKPLLTVTIYGSYNPPAEKRLLLALKEALIKEGYEQTRIVEDYMTSGDDPLEVSKQCLLYSDVNLLVFTKEGKQRGLVRELAFIAESPDMIPKAMSCVAFDQLDEGKSSIPPLSVSDIKTTGIHLRTFESMEELKKAILNTVYWQLRRLSPSLSRRR